MNDHAAARPSVALMWSIVGSAVLMCAAIATTLSGGWLTGVVLAGVPLSLLSAILVYWASPSARNAYAALAAWFGFFAPTFSIVFTKHLPTSPWAKQPGSDEYGALFIILSLIYALVVPIVCRRRLSFILLPLGLLPVAAFIVSHHVNMFPFISICTVPFFYLITFISLSAAAITNPANRPRPTDAPAYDLETCTRCGYSLSGLVVGSRCPECGKRSPTRPPLFS